jgi:hypothetical protein
MEILEERGNNVCENGNMVQYRIDMVVDENDFPTKKSLVTMGYW